MTNIYETTIIVKPDLANDQMKSLNTSIDQFFSENDVSIGYKEDWGIKNLKSSKLSSVTKKISFAFERICLFLNEDLDRALEKLLIEFFKNLLSPSLEKLDLHPFLQVFFQPRSFFFHL